MSIGMNAKFLVAPLLLLATLTACTNRQMYEAMQASRRSECQKYDDEARARCLEVGFPPRGHAEP